MLPTTLSWTLAVIAILLCVYRIICKEAFRAVRQQKPPVAKRWKLPPGPSPSPIVGNLFQILKARCNSRGLPAYFSSLSQYGEMVTLQMGSKTWVLLNSNRVVTEIIAKRGSITHERPYFPIASGLVSHDKRSVLRQTAEWAEDRRIMHQLLNGHALKTYGVWQEVESVHLLATYVYRPREWYRHHNWYSNSVVHRIVLGERLQRSSPELAAFELTTRQFINSINGNVIDFFPSLVKLPKALQFWRRYWEKLGQFHQSVYQIWWKPVKQAIVEGTAPASFVRDALLHGDTKYTGDDTEAMWLAMGVIAAGSDNIRMTLNTFVMAMLCHPQILQKAQREIDRVCHSCNPDVFRLPGLDDMPLLPYISALIKEILRWRPVVPLIPQHQLTQDLEFEEYHFPRGTDFVINSSAVCAEFEASEEFRPERWLDEQGNEGSITHGLWQFGGGRRICVGYKVAQQELFVAVARLCFCFNFEAGGPYDSHDLRHDAVDEPFPVRAAVRSEEHKQLITCEAEALGFLESAKRGV